MQSLVLDARQCTRAAHVRSPFEQRVVQVRERRSRVFMEGITCIQAGKMEDLACRMTRLSEMKQENKQMDKLPLVA